MGDSSFQKRVYIFIFFASTLMFFAKPYLYIKKHMPVSNVSAAYPYSTSSGKGDSSLFVEDRYALYMKQIKHPHTAGAPQKKAVSIDIKKTAIKSKQAKVAYLTFDDGPSSKITPQILEILEKYNIKATFFVIGCMARSSPEIVKREQREGHLVCNHSYSHKYSYLYSSTDNFIKDIKECDSVLTEILGSSYTSRIIRFPGGSGGKKHKEYINALKQQGYNCIDWNCLTGDSEGVYIPQNMLFERFMKTSSNKNKLVILMHDSNGKQTTVDTLPMIIEYIKNEGYTFDTMESYKF